MRRIKYFGPPGTGKTETLLRRVESFRDETGCAPDQVGFVTFTRTAREEALNRLGGGEATWPQVRTLHSLCYRGLGLSQGRMVGRGDIQRFADLVGVEIKDPGESQDDDEVFQELPVGDQLLRVNHLGRHRRLKLMETMAVLGLTIEEKLARHFTSSYRVWKDQERLLDYTDLLTMYLERGESLRCRLFIVDEAQDLSPLQWSVAEKMGGLADEFIVAGDDDQAIYSWAGASADQFIDWSADETVVLSQSHRLPIEVWEKAEQLSRRIQRRQPKLYRPKDSQGYLRYSAVLPELEDEAALVLYRYGHRGKQLARELRDRGVPFSGKYSPLSIPSTQAALRALSGSLHKDDLQAARLLGRINQPKTVRDLTKAYYHDYLVYVSDQVGLEGMLDPQVTLSSIHQAKGRQSRTVILDHAMSRSSYEHLQLDPDDEHRVWYVGASRASDTLLVLESGRGRYAYDI